MITIPSKFKLSSWNANGIGNKITFLINYLTKHKIDIMLLNETKLTQGDKLSLRGYITIRRDRAAQNRGGGVAVLIKSNIAHTHLTLRNTSVENVCVTLKDDISIVAVYNSPVNGFTAGCLENLINAGPRCLVIGDLNARHIAWNCHRNNANGCTLFQYVNNHNVILQYPNDSTHFPNNGGTPSTIDIVVNKGVTNSTLPVALDELTSDHNPIQIELKNMSREDVTRKITSYRDANWRLYKTHINTYLTLTNTIDTTTKLESVVEEFARVL